METPENGTPEVQLQQLPSCIATLLPSDLAAWELVASRAAGGSGFHREALSRLGTVEFGPL